MSRDLEVRILSDDRPPCGHCASICDEIPRLTARERLARIPWQSLQCMHAIACSSRKIISEAPAKDRHAVREAMAGFDPRDYPDVYLTIWHGVSYGAVCFTKNMEGILNCIITILMDKLGSSNKVDIEAWIDGHFTLREEGMPPSMNVAPIPGFEKILGGEAMQALGTSLAFWIDAAIIRQRDTADAAWPSLMQAHMHLGKAMGPVTARELISKAAAAKEKEALKVAVISVLSEVPDKSLPTLYIAFLKIMIDDRVKKARDDEGMNDENLYKYLDYVRKKSGSLRSELERVTIKTSRGATTVAQREAQETMLSEIVESDPAAYDVVRKQIDKYKK